MVHFIGSRRVRRTRRVATLRPLARTRPLPAVRASPHALYSALKVCELTGQDTSPVLRTPDALTAALLRERLSGTQAPEDPFDVIMPAGSERWPALVRERVMQTLRPAGVLIPVIERVAGLSVLLTQRSADLKHHAGQVSFPGGRMEKHDRDVVQAALRETHEEVGIPPQSVGIVGYLPPMPTVTGYAVTAVVGLLADDVSLQLDHTEVEYAFEVPLAFLLDSRNELALEREYQGRRIPTVEFHYEGERIWGATAHILVELRKMLFE